MTEQEICLACGKPYYWNWKGAKGSCICPPDKRRILKEAH